MTKTTDTAILIDNIAAAAVARVGLGNEQAALSLTRYAAAVLPISDRVACAWRERDWDYAAAIASSDAVHAIREMAA